MPILYVSHSTAEVARLATTVVALRDGRIAAQGSAAQVLGDVAAVGARGIASVLEARVVAHDPVDGLTELATAAGRLWLPQLDNTPGTRLRVRIAAQDVILARAAPQGVSALNILSGTITDIRNGDGPGALVTLAIGAEQITAHVTRRSVQMMGLSPGQPCHAIIKTIALAPRTPDGATA